MVKKRFLTKCRLREHLRPLYLETMPKIYFIFTRLVSKIMINNSLDLDTIKYILLQAEHIENTEIILSEMDCAKEFKVKPQCFLM